MLVCFSVSLLGAGELGQELAARPTEELPLADGRRIEVPGRRGQAVEELFAASSP